MEEPPLTDKELVEIREFLEANRRAKWLMDKIKAVALWSAAVIGGFTLLGDVIIKTVKSIIK